MQSKDTNDILKTDFTTSSNQISHKKLQSIQDIANLKHLAHNNKAEQKPTHNPIHYTHNILTTIPQTQDSKKDSQDISKQSSIKKPKVYVSCGDINGIGLELILRNHTHITQWCEPIYCIHHDLLVKAAQILNLTIPKNMNLHEIESDIAPITQGVATAQSGMYSFLSFQNAVTLSIENNASVVTLPINKYAWKLAGIHYAGHTEYLRQRFQKKAIMMLGCEDMFVALYTDHIPLKDVVKYIQKDLLLQFLEDFYISFSQLQKHTNPSDSKPKPHDILAQEITAIELDSQANVIKESLVNSKMVARLLEEENVFCDEDSMQEDSSSQTLESLESLESKTMQIAVLGVNPHAGDNGVLGDEDFIIQDCIQEMNKKLEQEVFVGPIPPDSAFIANNRERFQVFIAMYHDSGLAPLKALYFERSINVSLNLPILRTSPDHGTGFDKAYKKDSDLNMQSYLESFYFIFSHRG